MGLLELLADNYAPIAGEGALAALARARAALVPRPRLPHGLRASEQDVQAHYDLSNAFFALWLDPSMTYSCAVFETPEQSLAEAQQHKYRAARATASGSVPTTTCSRSAPAGAAWPSTRRASAAAASPPPRSRTAQHELATRRVAEAGLADRVEVLERDYRRLDGTLRPHRLDRDARGDRPRSAADVLRAIDRLLAPNGVVAIQTITIPEQRYRSYRRSEDWLRRHIFPGGLLPVGRRDRAACALVRRRLGVYRLDEIGPHYAPTLGRWRERFLERVAEVRALGFDERFCRTWEFYLAYCEAAFASRAIRDVQLVLARPFERDAADRSATHGPSPGARRRARGVRSAHEGDSGAGRSPAGSTTSPASSGGARR